MERPLIVENYNKVKDNYHPNYPYHWAWKIFSKERSGRNPSLTSICKSLGIYEDFLSVYSTNSAAVHNTPLMRNFLTGGKGVTSTPNFTEGISLIAGISLEYAIEIIISILKYIRFPDFDEIEYYLNHLYAKTYLD